MRTIAKKTYFVIGAVSDEFAAGVKQPFALHNLYFFFIWNGSHKIEPNKTEIVYGPVSGGINECARKKYTVQKTKNYGVIRSTESCFKQRVQVYVAASSRSRFGSLYSSHFEPIFSLYFPFWYMRITKFDDYNAKRDVYQFSELFPSR